MILGSFKVEPENIVQNAGGNYTVFLKNIKRDDVFLKEVVQAHPHGIPIAAGDIANIILSGAEIPIMITEVKEYCIDYEHSTNGLDTIATLVFTCSRIGPVYGDPDVLAESIPEIEPFPIKTIFCSDNFIAIEMTGDIGQLMTNPELYQKYVMNKYSKFQYLGKVYYLCTDNSPKVTNHPGFLVGWIRVDHNDGYGHVDRRIKLNIIASTSPVYSGKEYKRFVEECKLRFAHN